MKIAQVNVYFYPNMVGGAEWYVYNISKELVKRGHSVDVFTSDTLPNSDKTAPTQIEGVNIHRLPLRFNISYRAKVWSGLKEAIKAGGYDIIHTYDYAQPHTFAALKLGKALGIPVALTIFDVHSLIPRPIWKRLPMSIFDSFFAADVLRKASAVLVRAPNLVPRLREMGLPPELIRITPSGILDGALDRFDGSRFLARYSLTGSPIILYFGRLHPMKGPQHLLKAAPQIIKKHPDAKFILIGPEQDGFSNQMRVMVGKLGISEHVSILDPIYNFQEKMDAYASCDVFTLPSGYEGTSQAIFEAMSQGKPVVATNRGGIPFQIKDGHEGLLTEYGDVDGLAEAILRLLEDRKFASDVGANARTSVRRYTYSSLAAEVESIYREILGSAANARTGAITN